MKFFRFIPIVLLVICINSCDRKSCETDNPIFLNHTINHQDYKIELAKQIELIGQQNLRYWLHDNVNQDDSEYLQFYVQNDDLCAEMLIKMNHWNNLEHIQKTKGNGSFNAEFKDLRFDINKNELGEVEFIYKNYERIID